MKNYKMRLNAPNSQTVLRGESLEAYTRRQSGQSGQSVTEEAYVPISLWDIIPKFNEELVTTAKQESNINSAGHVETPYQAPVLADFINKSRGI